MGIMLLDLEGQAVKFYLKTKDIVRSSVFLERNNTLYILANNVSLVGSFYHYFQRLENWGSGFGSKKSTFNLILLKRP